MVLYAANKPIRKSSLPELYHKKIYDALGLAHRPGNKIKTILLDFKMCSAKTNNCINITI